jgi:hypothetical protein
MSEWLKILIIFIIVLAIMAAFIMLITLLASSDKPIKYELLTINVDSRISGSFFLGCGGIGDTTEFYFYTKDSTGAITFHHEDADFITIYEDIKAGNKAYAINKDCDWYIHIPSNSIIREINLNWKQGGRN